ncbi:hypothetical protein [Armatimonas sp.]|uniref:hypothetical protein n=1 Tax=Armatimonas sp. TaxID=1872638 RepID=UPI00374DAD90
MAKLPEGFTLPDGIKLEDLSPDPGKRYGHYLHKATDTVYALGVRLELSKDETKPKREEAKPAAPIKDITGTKVKFADGRRGVVTEPGDPEEEDPFFARVLVDGEEILVKTKDEIAPLTPTQIKAWDKEIADAAKK